MNGMTGLNFGYNNSENDLMKSLQRFLGNDNTKTQNEPQQSSPINNNYEIESANELEYLKPDESGRLQMVYCRPEKRVYAGRFNFTQKKMIWEAFLSEGEISLTKNNQDNENISKVADALTAVANRLESITTMQTDMQNDIKQLKEKSASNDFTEVSNILKDLKYKQAETNIVESVQVEKQTNNRAKNGQFLKKGDK